MERFEKYLLDILPSLKTIHPHINQALKVMVEAGGKRFRPMLLLKVVEAYEPLLLESSFQVAAAVEIFHTYSLIHDDLPSMDDASLRRGVETLHKRYDEALAILVGDAFNTYAFELIATAPLRDDVKVELIKILSQNGGIRGMVLGQALDIYFENIPLKREDIIELHKNKTAKLIGASLKMGGVIVDLSKELQDKLYQLGIEIGILFQIQDDILDLVSNSQKEGKDVRKDENKNNFALILGLKEAINEADRLAKDIETMLDSFDNNLQKALKDILSKYLYRHKI